MPLQGGICPVPQRCGWTKAIAEYCGNETVVQNDAVRCFGFAAAATGGSVTVVTCAARILDGSSAARPTGVISKVAKDGWTIATVNEPTASGSFRLA